MCAVTAQLLINVTAAIEQLMGTPRKPGSHRAEMVRCCGELDKEEARGWLVADCVGRPLLHRNDDRSQNDARDVGKRVLERAGRAKADIAAAKETGRDAVRAATRAAAKDPSQQQLVADAESAREQAAADACAAPIDLDFPDAAAGRERPNDFWRSRQVQKAEGAAATVAARATVAAAAQQGTEARLNRAWEAMEKPGAPDTAVDRWLSASTAEQVASADARRAALEAKLAAADAAHVNALRAYERGLAAYAEDFGTGGSRKRKREEEAPADEGDVISDVVADMITAVVAHERAEPYWISLKRWHYLAEEERWLREMCALSDARLAARYGIQRPRAADEAWACYREQIMAGFEADAEAFEMKCRAMAWAAEAEEDPAVLAMARRYEACDDTDDDPYPDPDDFPASPDDAAWDAAVAAWEARRDAAEPLIARADRVVSERIMGRMRWKSALRMRLEDMGDLPYLSHVYGRSTLYGHVSHADAE